MTYSALHACPVCVLWSSSRFLCIGYCCRLYILGIDNVLAAHDCPLARLNVSSVSSANPKEMADLNSAYI